MTALVWVAVAIGLACGALVLAAFTLLVIVGLNDKRHRADLANSGHVTHPSGPPRSAP